MGFASRCACGNQSESFGGRCDRCVSLHALELQMHATDEEIESAFREMVRAWHPDRFEHDPNLMQAAEEKLKEINAAHAFLVSDDARRTTPRKPRQPRPPEPIVAESAPSQTAEELHETKPAPVQKPTAEPLKRHAPAPVPKLAPEPPETNAPAARAKKATAPAARKEPPKDWMSPLLVRAGVAMGAVAAAVILWLIVDGVLSSNSMTGGPWGLYKAEIARDIEMNGRSLWNNVTPNVHSGPSQTEESQRDRAFDAAPQQPASVASPPPAFQQPAEPTTPQVPQPEAAQPVQPNPARYTMVSRNPAPAAVAAAPLLVAQPLHLSGAPHIKVGGSREVIKPYVTSGLTPLEVLSILGNPTSSSGEKMFYKDSEIDFRNGRVAGWSIDPKMAPLRVKLWPDKSSVSRITQFAFGSSKNDVIALQGTPTLFSDNKFGYGDSIVYFQNGRVIGWDEDPNSVRLHVAH